MRQKLGLFVLLMIPMLLVAQDPARQVPANLREAVIDDFTVQRLGSYSGSPLFFPNLDAEHSGQSLTVAGGQLVNGAATGGLLNMYFWHKDYLAATCIWPDGSCYLRNRLQSGIWSPDFNRMSFRWRCDNTISGNQTGTQNHLGTYARNPAYTNAGDQESNGWHFYHEIHTNQSPWRWVWATVNTHPQHMRANETAGDQAIPANVTMPTGNYFDLLTNFYFDRKYTPFAGSTCYFDDWTLGTQTGEPDYHVSTLTYQYTGNHYEVAWQAGRISEATTYDLRYSVTGSLKAAGFLTGTDSGTVSSPAPNGRTVYWISQNIAESPEGLWVGIRPRMPVQSATAATPVSVGVYQHGLTTGDAVYCSGLGVTAAGDYTATVVDANTITLDSSAGGGNFTSGGYCKATSNTTNFTEIFIPLTPLAVPGWPLGVTFSSTSATATTLNFTPEYSATSTTVERRIPGQAWTGAGTTVTGSFADSGLNPGTRYQYRFKSSNTTGTGGYSDTHVAHVYPAVTTVVDAEYPIFTTVTLPDANVGAVYSRQLSATGGTAPYAFVVDAGTLPAGLSLSPAGLVSGTPTTFTPQPGVAVTLKVIDANGHTGYVGLYFQVNQLPARDDFNRADGYVNASSDWTATSMFYNMYVIGNALKPVGNSGSRRIREWFSVDHWAEAKITAIAGTESIGPGVRNDPNYGGYFCFQSQTQLCLTRWQKGGLTVTQTCADVAWQPNDVVRAEAFDSTIRCFSNGVLKVSIANADIPSGTPGIGGSGGTGTLADDWSGGNISTPIITTETLLDAVVGYSYSATFSVVRGVEPFTWSVATGTLPAGLTLSSTGVLSGTPTAGGTVSFAVRAVDSEGTASADKTLTLTTLASVPPLSVATATLTEGRTAIAYTHTLAAVGGLSPYTWSLASGSLPTGLSLSAGGVINGTTFSAGSVSITVRATDRLGGTADQPLVLTVIATVSASDNFNRANESVNTHNGWRAVAGTGGFFVVSNAVRVYDSISTKVAASAYGNLAPASDQYALVKWKASSAGPAVRLTTAATGGYGCVPAGGKLGIYPIVPAYYWGTVLAETDYAPVVGDELKLTASGSTLKCYVNGVEMLSVTDSRYAIGYTGIVGHSNGIVDDWEGGNISAPSSPTAVSRAKRVISQ